MQVKALRLREVVLVVVRGAEDHEHVLPGGDADAAQRGVRCGCADKRRYWGLDPEHLLDRGRDGRRVHHDLGPARRLAQQVVERVANEVGGRLVPGKDEAHHLVHQLGLAEGCVAAARDERARDVLARVLPLPGDVLAQEVLVLNDALRDGNLPLRGHDRRHQREEVLPPALEVLDVAVIHIAEARDDPERQRERQLGDHLRAPLGRQGIEE